MIGVLAFFLTFFPSDRRWSAALNIYFCLPKIFFFCSRKKTAVPGDYNPLEALFVLYSVFIMHSMLGFRGRKKMNFVKLNKRRICSFLGFLKKEYFKGSGGWISRKTATVLFLFLETCCLYWYFFLAGNEFRRRWLQVWWFRQFLLS